MVPVPVREQSGTGTEGYRIPSTFTCCQQRQSAEIRLQKTVLPGAQPTFETRVTPWLYPTFAVTVLFGSYLQCPGSASASGLIRRYILMWIDYQKERQSVLV